jgi:hypothetical protein
MKRRVIFILMVLAVGSVVYSVQERLYQISGFVELDKIHHIARDGGGEIALSNVVRSDVKIVCQFWPYSELDFFEEHPIYPHLNDLEIFPIEESDWWLAFFGSDMMRIGQEKFFRVPSRFSLDRVYFTDGGISINPRIHCQEVSTVSLIVSEDAGVYLEIKPN